MERRRGAWSGAGHGAGGRRLQRLQHPSPAVPWGPLAPRLWVASRSASPGSWPPCPVRTFQLAPRTAVLKGCGALGLLGAVFLPQLWYPSRLASGPGCRNAAERELSSCLSHPRQGETRHPPRASARDRAYTQVRALRQQVPFPAAAFRRSFPLNKSAEREKSGRARRGRGHRAAPRHASRSKPRFRASSKRAVPTPGAAPGGRAGAAAAPAPRHGRSGDPERLTQQHSGAAGPHAAPAAPASTRPAAPQQRRRLRAPRRAAPPAHAAAG